MSVGIGRENVTRVLIVQAVVFDLDGVLVDTDHIWHEVREGLRASAAGAGTRQIGVGHDGDELDRVVAVPPRQVGLAEPPAELSAEVVRRMLARYTEELLLIAGAASAVDDCKGRSIRRRSSSNRKLIDSVLDAAGLADRFRSNGLVGGGPTRQTFTRRLPRGGASPRRPARALCRGRRGLQERDPRRACRRQDGSRRLRTFAIPHRRMRSPSRMSCSRPSTSSTRPPSDRRRGPRRSLSE